MKKGIINRIKVNKKSIKLHLSIVSFIIFMTLIFISFVVLVPKSYKGEQTARFLDTPLSKIIKTKQENISE